ncbi:MAG: DNA repair protein RadC [candidate division KSB1 bacterium]|nr:DNA repair protein RadC [candidate division KSB1 bacterium]MDZ7304763.1 DNA repair protein RadC [candidate division KSB1 bacterium]MDZ7314203.1 DNA repair protein RadC [candidate division KSB1 bacterium]
MEYKIRITDLPEDQRPRERLIQHGPESLSDAELLAIILRTGDGKRSAIDLAHHILNQCHGFRGLDAMSIDELCGIRGVGPAKAAQIKAALTIGRKLVGEKLPERKHIQTSRDVFDLLHSRLRNLPREVFIMLLLTARNRLIKEQKLYEGTLTQSMVTPREVLKEAINGKASAVIFVHNHPSGEPSPSLEDRQITKQLVEACKTAGIIVHDHIIIGDEKFFSFADEGLL